VAADLNERKKNWRARSEIAVGATAAAPKYQAQLTWLEPHFLRFAESDGFVGTSSSTGETSFSGVPTGPDDDQEASVIRSVMDDLRAALDGATQTPAARSMRWAARPCES
jgi:hypothetical protein